MTDPDRRALSHMSPEVLLVHLRLEVWGRWAKDPNPGDWPERTILAKLIEEGPGASASTAKVPEIPPGIAETDKAVAHLAHDETLVIKTYYLHWAPTTLLYVDFVTVSSIEPSTSFWVAPIFDCKFLAASAFVLSVTF